MKEPILLKLTNIEVVEEVDIPEVHVRIELKGSVSRFLAEQLHLGTVQLSQYDYEYNLENNSLT